MRLLNAAVRFSWLRDVALRYPRKRHRVVAPHSECSSPIRTKARSLSPAVLTLIRAARLRRHGSTWTAFSIAIHLGCWAPQLTAGKRSDASAAALAKASTTQRAWITWRFRPHGNRTGHHVSSGAAQKRTGARLVPTSPPRLPEGSSSWCLATGILRPQSFFAAPPLPLLWLSVFPSLPLHH